MEQITISQEKLKRALDLVSIAYKGIPSKVVALKTNMLGDGTKGILVSAGNSKYFIRVFIKVNYEDEFDIAITHTLFHSYISKMHGDIFLEIEKDNVIVKNSSGKTTHKFPLQYSSAVIFENINKETDSQIKELIWKVVEKKEFTKAFKESKRFCGEESSRMPLQFNLIGLKDNILFSSDRNILFVKKFSELQNSRFSIISSVCDFFDFFSTEKLKIYWDDCSFYIFEENEKEHTFIKINNLVVDFPFDNASQVINSLTEFKTFSINASMLLSNLILVKSAIKYSEEIRDVIKITKADGNELNISYSDEEFGNFNAFIEYEGNIDLDTDLKFRITTLQKVLEFFIEKGVTILTIKYNEKYPAIIINEDDVTMAIVRYKG